MGGQDSFSVITISFTPDPSSGSVTAYYDPRDSSLFQFLQQLNSSSELSPLELAVQLDEFRVSRLNGSSLLTTTDINAFSKLVQQQLFNDFPSNASGTPFLDDLVIPALKAAESKDSPLNGLSDHIDAVLSQIQLSREESRKYLRHSPSTVASSSFPERTKLYEYYVQNSALFYPLVIDEQIRRRPFNSIDGNETEKRIARELFPVCQVPESDRKQFLIDHEGFEPNSDRLDPTLWTYNELCKASFVDSMMTSLGKSIYITSSMRPSQDIRSHGRLRGCRYPAAHLCANRIHDGHLENLDAQDLRLDHHFFRSFQQRSFDYPEWRGGPLGYVKDWNYTVLQTYLDSIVDTGKLRFVRKVRQRLAQLLVVPKMPDYTFNTKTNNGEINKILIGRQNAKRKCSAIELLGGHQFMCPPDFPYVGYWVGDDPYQPYSWCSDVLLDPADNNIFGLGKYYPKEKHLSRYQLLNKHTVFCPGYGETRCCDYDSALESYQ